MKFYSKQSNYRVVLRPGTPREPLTGREAVAGIHVKFEGGVANVSNEDHIELMMAHPAYITDYISEKDNNATSFSNHKEVEPVHTTADMKYGHMENVKNPKPIGVASDPAKAKEIMDIATKITSELMVKKEAEITEKAREELMNDIREGKISIDDIKNTDSKETKEEEKVEVPEESETEKDSVEVPEEDLEPKDFEKKELKSEAAALNNDAPLDESPNLA